MPDVKPTPSLRFTAHPKPRLRTTKIVVHHTAGAARQTVEEIHAYHQKIGWIGVGYNLVQTADGVWREGRGMDAEGAHASGHNSTTIGVVLTGNFEAQPVPADRYESLVDMCVYLVRRYGLTSSDVVGHRELPGAATLCPGRHIDMGRLRSDVDRRLVRSAPVWRLFVDGTQVGAYLDPTRAVAEAVGTSAREIILRKS